MSKSVYGRYANTSLDVDSTFRIAGGEEEITTTPLDQALWDEMINTVKMVT
jgi:hypothetical protein